MQVVLRGGSLVEALGGDLLVGAPDFPQVVQRGEGPEADLKVPLFPQLRNGDALVVMGFGEGVFQRSSAVANPGGEHVLGAMEVAQSHIVKVRKNLRVHTVGASDAELLGFTGGGARHKLVGQQHVALGRVDCHVANGHPEGVGIGLRGFLRVKPPDMGGLEEGKQPEVDGAVFIPEGDGLDVPAEHRGEVDAAGVHQTAAEGQTLRAVVVPADDEHRKLSLGQLAEKIVKHRDGLPGGDGFVIDVPADQQGLGLLFIEDIQDLPEDQHLLRQHGHFVNPLTKMQVGQVNQFHGMLLCAGRIAPNDGMIRFGR